MKPKKIILIIFEVIFAILLVFSLYKIVVWFTDNKENDEILDDISKSIKINKKKNEYEVNFGELKSQNPDTVAWIKVNGTNIEYPVVKATNNEFYLNHNFEGKYNVGGWIFADYKNRFDGTDKNIVLYGHNMRNGSMFGTLKDTLKQKWQSEESNFIITFITEDEINKYKVFSTYKVENEEYYITTNFSGATDYMQFLSTIKQRSNKYYNEKLDEQDEILTLSSCDTNNKYRIVLHAKKIE